MKLFKSAQAAGSVRQPAQFHADGESVVRVFCIGTILSLLLAATNLSAAESKGTVRFGGQPVSGASVTAAQGDKRFTTITDLNGTYLFPDLADGTWNFTVDMLCFVTQKRDLAVAPTAAAAEWDLQLQPMETIRAAAGPAPAKAVFQRTEIAKAPEPAPPPPPDPAKPAPKQQTKAAEPAPDASQANDAFAINGSIINAAASPFGTSGAFGNFRKNGNGLYHGALGIIEDTSALDARNYSLTGQDTPKAAYNHLSGVFSFGGPIYIPRTITDGKTTFFFGYQMARNRNSSTPSTRMPTSAQRNGDLTGLATVTDPLSGQPFAGNMIPASRISPQALFLLRYYPLPNFTSSSAYNYQVPLVSTAQQDAVNTRINRSIGSKDSVYGTFAWQGNSSATPNLFGFRDTGASTGWNMAANWSHRINTKIFLHTQYNFSRFTSRITPFFSSVENVSKEAGINGNNQDPLNWGPPQINFSSGIASLNDAQQSLTRNMTNAYSGDLLWVRRSHNMTFGTDYKRVQFNALSQQDPRGTLTFNGTSTGNDFAGFLLGLPDTTSIAYGNADKYFRQKLYDAYFTDDWRVAPGVTANVGGRWEYSTPVTEKYDRLINLAIAPNFTTATPVRAVLQPDHTAGIQPRIGLSWRPIAGSSTVIRSGYGLYTNTSVYQSIASQMAQQSPLSTSLSFQNTQANPLTLAQGFPAIGTGAKNTYGIDPNFRVGFAHNWNLSIQQDLPWSLVGTATYLGIKGTRAVQQFLPNTYPLGTVNPCPSCPAGFAYVTSNGNSTRESLQLQLRRRLRAGFTSNISYTYAKAIDDALLGGRGQGAAVIAQDWLNLSGERGRSNFDQRHLLNFTTQYSTGMGVHGGALMTGWRGVLFKEWTLTTQLTAGSGLPETPLYSVAVAGTGVTGSIRPSYTGAPLYDAPSGLNLNPAAFAAPSAGHWGNAGRNSITGPGQFAFNISAGRTFRISDRFSADLRMDSSNTLNHPVFGAWNASITSSQFGLPVSPGAMRLLQTNLRVRF